MDNCVFCKIINGELPSYKIYEDEKTLCFMDISNDVDGHLLVIPKKHVKNVLDSDGETLSAVANTTKKVSTHLTTTCGYDGVNILNASDESAGQSVFHLHFHIIPRRKNDGINAWPHFEGAKHTIEDNLKKLKMN